MKQNQDGRPRHCGLDPQSRGAGQGNTCETSQTNQHRPRHCGLDPQSRGAVDQPVILASRQYPQGGVATSQNNQQNPLSLDGGGIKGEGENDAPHRPVIADLIRNPEVRRPGRQQANTTYRIPSPLTRENQSLSQCLTLGAEGETSPTPTQPVILASRQNPQGGVRVTTSQTNHIPLSLDGRGPKPVPVPDTGSRG